MPFLLEEPWALAALFALFLPLFALLRRKHRRVVVPSVVIHRLVAQDTISVPRNIPWGILMLEAGGLVAVVGAMAMPAWRTGQSDTVVTVVDNSMWGGASSSAGGRVITTVPDAPATMHTHVPGDITSAIFRAAMIRGNADVVVMTCRKTRYRYGGSDSYPRWLYWGEMKRVMWTVGFIGMWPRHNSFSAGLKCGKVKPTEVPLEWRVDGVKLGTKALKLSEGYDEVAFPEVARDVTKDLILEMKLNTIGMPVDAVYAILRKKNTFHVVGKDDAVVSTALKAMGWAEAAGEFIVTHTDKPADAPGIYILSEGEETAGGRVAFGKGFEESGVVSLNVPSNMIALPVPQGEPWVPFLYAEGKPIAAVDPAGRRIVLGFAAAETEWRDSPSWPVVLGMMLEAAGYPLNGISWHITGDLAVADLDGPMKVKAGQRVLLAGVYEDASGRLEAYNALWPEELAVEAGEAPPVELPPLPESGAVEQSVKRVDAVVATVGMLLLAFGAALWVRRKSEQV